jgi:hypothetical protein
MPETKQSDCVLCNSLAQFEYHNDGQIRYYKCKLCHYYAISERAVRYLQKHPKRKFNIAQKVIKMSNEIHILEITYDSKIRDLKLAKVSRNKYF